jgi:hypothetical protein
LPSLDLAAPKYVIDGKPDYISVVFSFACVFYQVLTGEKALACDDDITNILNLYNIYKN